ncbi:RNA polymerase sigma-70 factor (sigma-E family) [Kribbella steppae]|uniref:RNA polymerase sigma-70 factor (Sigma-E family) n=1 Tax=Kribbella steppae TaxID=2512223 RepID=A0A4R2HK01_9ACTN|nr:SigE family RNA polymerase sigma factor [Kribbella steppae]TCO30298.1 RNA polymerase sigma-70 factor (sigma-E family) [Kribbella steppae]
MANHRDQEFTDYVSAHRGRMVRIARLLTSGDAHWAEDLVQTALTRLYLKWGAISPATGATWYADKILMNVFLDEKRRFWRHRETLTDDVSEPRPSAAAGPEDRLTVLAALERLPKRQRAAVVLRYFCDLDVAAAAELMGSSSGTVKSQTARGLDKLRDLIVEPLDSVEHVR